MGNGSKYLTTLKKTNFDVEKTKILGVVMIYKGIMQFYDDLNPLKKGVEDRRSVISTYLSLKKVASLCCHPTNVGKGKEMCIEQVEPT